MLMKKILFICVMIAPFMMQAQVQKTGKISNVTNLTRDGLRYENPRWSPDGGKIAFTELGYDNLYVMNADGTSRVQVSSASGVGYMYQWSADSKEILVRDTRWEDNASGLKRNHAIWAVDMTGKKVRMSEDAEYMQPAAWRYSATGAKMIAAPDAKPIVRHGLAGLSKSRTVKALAQPVNKVSFYVDGCNLYVVDVNGNKKLINEGESFCPSLSPNGKKVAFNQMNNVCVMNIDGSGKTMIGRGFNPVWVNDTQIVFERTQDDGHVYTSGELYIANVDGTGLKAITATEGMIEMCPSISPDGKKIVFSSFSDGQIYIADFE